MPSQFAHQLLFLIDFLIFPLFLTVYGQLPIALPSFTTKKPRTARKVRPALRPSGGSGIGHLLAAEDGVAAAAAPATGNAMLALLENLNQELHGAEQEKLLEQATPTMPEAIVAGRLSDAGTLHAAAVGADDADHNHHHHLQEAAGSADRGEDGSAEGEVRGSNEAVGSADVAEKDDETARGPSEGAEFTFEPVFKLHQTTRKDELNTVTPGRTKRQKSPTPDLVMTAAAAGNGGCGGGNGSGSPSKKKRKVASPKIAAAAAELDGQQQFEFTDAL